MKSPERQSWERYEAARKLAIPNSDEDRNALFCPPLPPNVPRTFDTGYGLGKAMLDDMKRFFEACEDGEFGPATKHTLSNGMQLYLQGFRFLMDMCHNRGPFARVYDDESGSSDFSSGLVVGFWGELSRLIARADRDSHDSELSRMATHPDFLQVMSLCGGSAKPAAPKHKPASKRRSASS